MPLTKENVYEVPFPKANLLPNGEGSLNHNVITKQALLLWIHCRNQMLYHLRLCQSRSIA